MITFLEANNLIKELDALINLDLHTSNKKILKFLIKYKNIFKMQLDNDLTTVYFNIEKLNATEEEKNKIESFLLHLDNCLGDSDGVLDLLEVIGIDADKC